MHHPQVVVHRKAWLWLALVSVTLLLGAIAVISRTGIVTAQGPQPQTPQVALGTGFTYQGQLKRNGAPVNDRCDGIFRVYDSMDSLGSNNVVGFTLFPVFTVTNGLFTTALDFGPGVFDGNARWLDIEVACPYPSGLLTTQSPRQLLSAAPYALFSAAPWVTNGTALSYNIGNVGIGTTIPKTILDVNNVFRVMGAADAANNYPTTGHGFEAAYATNKRAGGSACIAQSELRQKGL